MSPDLISKIDACPTLPTLPTVAVEVLRLAGKVEADVSQIAELVGRDPALSGKLLRTVNSSFYARNQPVGTLTQAIVMLGLQSVRTLVLGFSLVSNVRATKSRGFRHMIYWKRSVYAATAARVIAQKVGYVQIEEAFLAALLKDIGMLVLDQVFGEHYGALHGEHVGHTALAHAETARFGANHAAVSGLLAQKWNLPPILAEPIRLHHSPNDVSDPSTARATALVSLAGRCADVFTDPDAGTAIAEARRRFDAFEGLDGTMTDELLAKIGDDVKDVAALFEIKADTSVRYETILRRANEALIELTLQTQRQAQATKQKASELEKRNAELKQRASTDALTGLGNRGHFDATLAEAFEHATREARPLSLMLLDLDKFKQINDMHGHQAGDDVLKHVAKLLTVAVRTVDTPARYGGEEIAVILPGMGKAAAAERADKLRRLLCLRPIPAAGRTLPVTTSIGVACHEPGGPFRTPAHLIKAADLAVYAAKKAGRNCVKVFTLTPEPHKAVAAA